MDKTEIYIKPNIKVNRIAIIDDDKITVFLATKAINTSYNDIQIDQYFNAQIALDAFKDESNIPDIILLDINMPDVNGWDFLDVFSKYAVNCKVFMYTSSIDSNDFDKSKTYNIVMGFVSKPLNAEKLKRILG